MAGHTFAYSYDSDGNRTSVKIDGTTTQSLSYNSANQISSSGYAYDGAGNLTAAPGASYSYNAAEQMTQSTVNGTTSSHVHAGTGQRELISAGGNQFVWGRNDQYGQPWLQSFNIGGQSQVYVERDQSGTPLGLHNAGNDFYLVLDNLGLGGCRGQHQFEGNYVQRYWKILDELSLDALKGSCPDPLSERDNKSIRSYILLCEDELEMRKNGYVSDNTYDLWADGIKGQFRQRMFKEIWKQVKEEGGNNKTFPYEHLNQLLDEKNTSTYDPLKMARWRRWIRGLASLRWVRRPRLAGTASAKPR